MWLWSFFTFLIKVVTMKRLPSKFMFGYIDGDSSVMWDVRDIWQAVENLPTIKLPVSMFVEAVKEVRKNYNNSDISRVNKADLKYPIVVNNQEPFLVVDGFHRLNKHLQLNNELIPCKRLDVMPYPYAIKGKPFNIPGLTFEWTTKFEKKPSKFGSWSKGIN